jgi:hypothetical protein
MTSKEALLKSVNDNSSTYSRGVVRDHGLAPHHHAELHARTRVHVRALLFAIVASIIFNLGFALGGIRTVGGAYLSSPGNVLPVSAVAGVQLFFVGIAGGCVSIGLTLVYARMCKRIIGALASLLIITTVGISCFIAVVCAGVYLLQIDAFFIGVDPLMQFMGGMTMIAYMGMTIMAVVIGKHDTYLINMTLCVVVECLGVTINCGAFSTSSLCVPN